MWPEINVGSLAEYEKAVEIPDQSTTTAYYDICYRGQTDESWDLKPSLWRLIPESLGMYDAATVEYESIFKFQRKARLILNPVLLPEFSNKLGWLTIMQHYNAPTRLLDWSFSPYVALYFAVQGNFKCNGAVWHYNRATLDHGLRTFGDKADISKVFDVEKGYDPNKITSPHGDHMKAIYNLQLKPSEVETEYPNERLLIQQGTFTVGRAQNLDHAVGIKYSMDNPATHHKGISPATVPTLFYRKIVVEAKAKRKILSKLNQMNINADSLFPGIDGLGRSIAGVIGTHKLVMKLDQSH